MKTTRNETGYDNQTAMALAQFLHGHLLNFHDTRAQTAFMGAAYLARLIIAQIEDEAEAKERYDIANCVREEFCRLIMLDAD
jgi:hypothetical protein